MRKRFKMEAKTLIWKLSSRLPIWPVCTLKVEQFYHIQVKYTGIDSKTFPNTFY